MNKIMTTIKKYGQIMRNLDSNWRDAADARNDLD